MTFSDIMSLAANSCPRRAGGASAPDISGSGPRRLRLGQPWRSVPRRWIEVLAPRDPPTKSAGGRKWI